MVEAGSRLWDEDELISSDGRWPELGSIWVERRIL